MEQDLSAEEVRVLGALMEKEMTTPEYYPLTLNALVAACNQKTNRDPVTSFDQDTVARVLEGLKTRGLAYTSPGSRAQRHGQSFASRHNMVRPEAALLCVLMLRGPQTPGELRSRTERMHSFGSVSEAGEALNSLEDLGMVKNVGRRPGQKETRFAHTLSGGPYPEEPAVPEREPAHAPASFSKDDKVEALSEEVKAIRQELEELKQSIQELRGMLDK